VRVLACALRLAVVLLPAAPVLAQSFAPTDISTRFLDDALGDSLLLGRFSAYGETQGLSPDDIRERYLAMRAQLSELVRTTLQQPCDALDRRYAAVEAGSLGFAAARRAYADALGATVDRLLQLPQSLYPLFEFNLSDRILSFRSEVDLQPDGLVLVRETIRVYNGNGQSQPALFEATMPSWNNDIQRGIVRDFPTRYLDSNGFWTVTGFRLRGLTRNGVEEQHVEEQLSNGVRIKAGNADVFLPEGVHTYVFEYETRNQLIFHPDKDELYWNVNGNGWVFTADTVSCQVMFPDGAVIRESACYTGPMGSVARDCSIRQVSDREIAFSNLQRLQSYEGLTIAAAIQKGVFRAPGTFERITGFLGANFILPLLSILFVVLSTAYGMAWYRRGRDPKKGTIIPQFEPPAGITPAELGYVLKQGYDSRQFAATLVDAAVHRELDIEVEQEGKIFKSTVYKFSKPSGGKPSSPDGGKSRYGINIDQLYGLEAERGKYNPLIKSLNTSLQSWLRDRLHAQRAKDGSWKGYFRLNQGYGIFGFILLVATLIASLIFLSMYYSPKIFLIAAVLFGATAAVVIIFSVLMKAYTPEGRKVTDHILGFRMYLDTTEQQVFQQLMPPKQTLELFERYLPYAIALGVENHWAEKFDNIIQQAIASGYQPSYYRGSMLSMSGFNVAAMSSGISSGLSSTISSASTPPSSSGGGSGGGGSSGGGGGGGGGGGW
jgi:uncharacterized membrane protein YgcG